MGPACTSRRIRQGARISAEDIASATTVLIAEDDEAVVRLLEDMLPKLGYDVAAVVSSGDEVVQLTRSFRPDVILMDVRLHGEMDGIEATRAIRDTSGIPVVFLTGFADGETLNRAKAADPQGYILKPFGLHDLQVGIEIAVSRHRLEQKITESRRWLEATLTCIGDGVVACDADRIVRLANPVFEEMSGQAASRLIGRSLHEVLPACGIETETINRVEGGHTARSRARAPLAEVELDGDAAHPRHLELSASPITGGDGRAAGLVIVARDVTDRKAAALSHLLRRQGDYFKALTENTNDLVLVLDDQRRNRYASPSLTRALDYRIEEVLERAFDELVEASHRPHLDTGFQRALEQPGQNVEMRLDLLHRGGQRRKYEIVLRNLLADPRVGGIVLNAHDITTSEAASLAIQHRERALELVSFANQQLLRSSLGEKVIDDVLRRFGEATGALQVSVFRLAQPDIMGDLERTWSWCHDEAATIDPRIVTDVHSQAQTDDMDESVLCGHGGSAVAFAIASADRSWGHLCVCHARAEGEWSAVDLETGRSVARALAAGFQRHAAEQRLRLLENGIQHLPMGITITDAGGRIVYTNSAEAEMHGYTVDELLGVEARQLAPKELWRQTSLERKLEDTPRCYESRNLHRSGHTFPVQLTSVVVSNDQDQAIGMVTGCQDISERKAFELALQRSEQDYKGLIENAHDAILILDPDGGCILEVNQQACEAYGVDRESLVGRPVTDLTVDPMATRRMIQHTLRHGSFRGLEAVHPRGNDDEMILEINSSLVNYKNRQAVLTINRDVTARRRAELQLTESREQLRRLAEHLQAAREEERVAVARTVHDELGQILTALKMDVALVKRRLSSDPQAAESKLDAMSEHIDSAISTVQQLATTLRPSILDNLGLVAAIEWHVDDVSQRSGIDCQLNLDDHELDVGPEIATALFRILQESLNNVVRHAAAKQVTIVLGASEETVSMSIQDDGIGIARDRIEHPDSLGLIGIRERARNLQGEAEICGFSGLGTRVSVLLPRHGPRRRDDDQGTDRG